MCQSQGLKHAYAAQAMKCDKLQLVSDKKLVRELRRISRNNSFLVEDLFALDLSSLHLEFLPSSFRLFFSDPMSRKHFVRLLLSCSLEVWRHINSRNRRYKEQWIEERGTEKTNALDDRFVCYHVFAGILTTHICLFPHSAVNEARFRLTSTIHTWDK